MKIRTQPIKEVLEFHEVRKEKPSEIKNTNIEEIQYIIKLIEKQLESNDFRSVAIITPHNEQQALFGRLLSEHPKYDEMKR